MGKKHGRKNLNGRNDYCGVLQSDSWKTSNSEFGILLGVERKCDSVVTKKELDVLRFYGGDIRKRTEEGKLLIINSSENPKDRKIYCGEIKMRTVH